jgi:hypothetical protein
MYEIGLLAYQGLAVTPPRESFSFPDEFSIAAYWTGHYLEGMGAAARCLRDGSGIPEAQIRRARRGRLRDPLMSHVRVAIITGVGRGIGAGVAKSFAAAGFRVSLMSPSDRSVRLAGELGGIGRQGSVLDPKDLAAVVEETRTAYGRIDAVVNNMGHGSGTPPSVTVGTVFDPESFPDPLAFPDERWHEALDMYVLTAVRMARAVTPIMVAQGGGSIVNIILGERDRASARLCADEHLARVPPRIHEAIRRQVRASQRPHEQRDARLLRERGDVRRRAPEAFRWAARRASRRSAGRACSWLPTRPAT